MHKEYAYHFNEVDCFQLFWRFGHYHLTRFHKNFTLVFQLFNNIIAPELVIVFFLKSTFISSKVLYPSHPYTTSIQALICPTLAVAYIGERMILYHPL